MFYIRHKEGRCQYTTSSLENNYCLYAHEQSELDEWQQRKNLLMKRTKFAKHKGLLPFTDKVLYEMDNADDIKAMVRPF